MMQALEHLFREQQTPRINEAWLREQSPIDFYHFLEDFAVFLAAGFLAFVHLPCEQQTPGIDLAWLREQSPIDFYYFLEDFAVFLAAGFLAFAGLLALLQNFT